jgi:hypothetical protein
VSVSVRREQSGGQIVTYHDQRCRRGRGEELQPSRSWQKSLDGVIVSLKKLSVLTRSRKSWWGERVERVVGGRGVSWSEKE